MDVRVCHTVSFGSSCTLQFKVLNILYYKSQLEKKNSLRKKNRSRIRLEKKSGAGAAKKISQLISPAIR